VGQGGWGLCLCRSVNRCAVGGLHVMIPYYMREGQESRRTMLEIGVAVAVVILAAACAVSSVPPLGRTMPVVQGQEKQQEHRGQLAAELQAALQQVQERNKAVEADLAANVRLLQDLRSELAGLKNGHNLLATQLTSTVAQVQQLETTVQQTSERLANSVDPKVLQQVTQERDEALAQTKQSDDQVRQLTLRLQKAGVFP
jgi:septal ring factor EnvC (AmiA/AmiB activator)